MGLIKGDARRLIVLVTLLLVLRTCSGLATSAGAGDDEHTHVLFEDGFEDGEADGWDIFIPSDSPKGSGWAVELDYGNYVLREWGHVWAEAGDFTWTNYTFNVKVKSITPQWGIHINFRMGKLGLRYFLQIWSEQLRLVKEHQGEFTEIKTANMAINPNKWYSLKIVCIGNRIQVYVDEALKLDYTDDEDPILSGRIGLESCENSNVRFDDVKVSTTYHLYIAHLIKKAQDEIDAARMVDADTGEAERTLAEAQAAFAEGDLPSAEILANEAADLAEHAPVGPVSVDELSKYSAEYDERTVEVSGTVRDIRYEEGVYRFAVDDGTGVVTATFDGSLGEIKAEDRVKVVGVFDTSTTTVMAESLEKAKAPMEGLYTFLIFKDDFEDGDYSDWRTDVNPEFEGSVWKMEREGDNHVLSAEGDCWSNAGDPEWTDYIFEVDVKLIKGEAGIPFRFTQKPPIGAEHYILHLSTYNIVRLEKVEIYLKEQRWSELKYVNVDLHQNEWYTVKIVCLENNIKVYLDDDLKLDYTDEDNPLLSGSIGLATPPQDGVKPSHVHFDDVKVSKMATTTDIDDLIAYAQTEIDEAREVNADTSSAELKLEQARQALALEEYKMVQYLVDEAVWLAKRSSVGQISVKNLRAMATRISGHTVTITGAVKSLEARYGAGYNFALDDGTGSMGVSYQGALVDIGDDYVVRVTGIFDSTMEAVAASRIEKVSGPTGQSPTAPAIPLGPFGINLSIESIATLISICGAGVGIAGWMSRRMSAGKRRKILFRKLMDDIDGVYSRFKMNTIRCEAELYKLRDQVLGDFKEGLIDEENYKVLNERIEAYMKEVKEEISGNGPEA